MSTQRRQPCSSNDPNVYLPQIWDNMMGRCYRPKHPSFRFYGGATPPVTVSERWRNVNHFIEDVLATIGERPAGLRKDGRSAFEFDRYPDPCGPYQLGNVRWALGIVNQRNKRPRLIKAKVATPKRPRKESIVDLDPFSNTALPWYLTNSNGFIVFNPGTLGRV